MKQIKVIGVGGIGTALLPFLCRYLNFDHDGFRITLVDGDTFEDENAKRQSFKKFGNKAEVKAEELARDFENISFRAIPEFVTKKNIGKIIGEEDIVFLGVDNHKTRKRISDYCETLSNVVLISGGNELTDGNVQVYVKKNGKDITVPLTRFHPEIQNPKDKSPDELSCEERAAMPQSRQIIVTNMGAAWLMFVAFWLAEQGKIDKLGEFYFDITEGIVQKMERRADEGKTKAGTDSAPKRQAKAIARKTS